MSKIFSIAGRNLKLDTRADIQPHLDILAAIDDLEEIHLGGNTLGVEACQALGEVLKTKKTLKVADFADIFTGRLITEIPDALRALCDALVDHENLVELDMSDNAFGGRSAEPMVNLLTHNHHFSVLKLNNNGLGISGGTIIAEALIAAAAELKTKGLKSNLRVVICGRNRLENGSAPLWAQAFAAHGCLVEVRMFQNGIRMEGIKALSQGLASCPHLEVLDFQDNTAAVPGSRAIAACLNKWPALKVLNLSDCLLKPRGGALVVGALEHGSNPLLEEAYFQYCDLDRKSLSTLGSAIDHHLPKLSKLEINGNWADEEDECITKIKAALAKWGHEDALDELDEMDPEGEEDEEEEDESEEEKVEESEEVKEAEAGDKGDTAAAAAEPVAGAAVASASTSHEDTDRLAEALEKTKIDATAVESSDVPPAEEVAPEAHESSAPVTASGPGVSDPEAGKVPATSGGSAPSSDPAPSSDAPSSSSSSSFAHKRIGKLMASIKKKLA